MALMPEIPTTSRASTATPSGLESALNRVGDRWSLLVVDALLDGPRRFGELRESLPAIAPNILTDRLRRLERERILVSKPYSTRPPRMEYTLTGDGRDLASALRLLSDWGSRRTGGEPLRHDRCGTPIEARWFCPTCGVPVGDAEISGTDETLLF
jgi:DNA-binding HxlR family transcriptional regulator